MHPARARWVIVAAGGLMSCAAVGALFSLPVFLTPIARDTGWSVTGISAAMTIAFLAMAVGSLAWGSLSDRIGPRAVVLAGSVLLAAGLAGASRMESLLGFQLLFGLVAGGAIAAIIAPLMAAVTGWFDTHRSLAVSLVSAGMGLAPMTMSPLAAWLVTLTDWRSALLLVAAIAGAIMIPLALLVRRPPALAAAAGGGAAGPGGDAGAGAGPSAAQVLRSPPFLVLMATNFFCCATHAGPITHTVSYAVSCGIPMLAAVSIYSVEGFAGLFGRIGFGLLGDRLGARRVLVGGLLAQAVGAVGFAFARELAAFYVAAALFGFIYAGLMPLYAAIARETFPLRLMGTVIGGIATAGSLGMALGPVAGGLIHDRLGDYAWLYAGAGLTGLAAAAVALGFTRLRAVRMMPAAA